MAKTNYAYLYNNNVDGIQEQYQELLVLQKAEKYRLWAKTNFILKMNCCFLKLRENRNLRRIFYFFDELHGNESFKSFFSLSLKR